MGGPIASMICWMLRPCDASRRMRLVAKSRPMPVTPASIDACTSSTTQRACEITFARSPSPAMRSASRCDCGDAAGEVTSTYSTPNASSAVAIAILSSVRKLACENCSPSRRVVSIRRKRVPVCPTIGAPYGGEPAPPTVRTSAPVDGSGRKPRR